MGSYNVLGDMSRAHIAGPLPADQGSSFANTRIASQSPSRFQTLRDRLDADAVFVLPPSSAPDKLQMQTIKHRVPREGTVPLTFSAEPHIIQPRRSWLSRLFRPS